MLLRKLSHELSYIWKCEFPPFPGCWFQDPPRMILSDPGSQTIAICKGVRISDPKWNHRPIHTIASIATKMEQLETLNRFFSLPSGKLTWQWKMDQLKMYSQCKMGTFHCHVSLLEGTTFFLSINCHLFFFHTKFCPVSTNPTFTSTVTTVAAVKQKGHIAQGRPGGVVQVYGMARGTKHLSENAGKTLLGWTHGSDRNFTIVRNRFTYLGDEINLLILGL